MWPFASPSTAPPRRPLWLEVRSSKWFIITTVSFAIFTDIFLYGLLSPVLPFALSVRAGVRAEDVQNWVAGLLAAFGGALLLGSPIFGWIADHTASRRVIFLVGLATVGTATGLLNIGNSVAILLVGRILQGLADAVVFAVGLALLVDTVGPAHIGAAMSFPFLALSLGILAGPLLGGVVYDRGGYNAVFAMAYALIAVDIVLRLVLIEKKVARKWIVEADAPDDDPLEIASAAAGPAPTPPHELTDPEMGAAVPAEGTPTTWKGRLPPVISMLSSRRLLTALWCTMVMASVYSGFETVYPLYVKEIFGWTATGAGLIFLADIAPSFLSPVVGRFADRYGSRYFVTGGFLLMVPPIVLLRLVDHNTIGQKVLLAALSAIAGLGLTLVSTPLLAEISLVVTSKEGRLNVGPGGAYAQAYGLWNSAFAAGTLVGPLWCGFVKATAGWKTMAWTLALLCAVTVFPALIFTGGFIIRPDPPPIPVMAPAAKKSKKTTTTKDEEEKGRAAAKKRGRSSGGESNNNNSHDITHGNDQRNNNRKVESTTGPHY
ncbi:MAG: hypothetical protein M1826_007099 [Phylliscum demangeonii]|nr:MAG: hypothetical protein M1826_007099 [Phylliscum demangeonii]